MREKAKADADKARRDKAAAENARREAAQMEESKKIEGKMLMFLQKATNDTTPKEMSLAGCKLGETRTMIVA